MSRVATSVAPALVDDDSRQAVPCERCRIGWVDERGYCDEPGCPGAHGDQPAVVDVDDLVLDVERACDELRVAVRDVRAAAWRLGHAVATTHAPSTATPSAIDSARQVTDSAIRNADGVLERLRELLRTASTTTTAPNTGSVRDTRNPTTGGETQL